MWNVVHTLIIATTSGTLKLGMWSGECGMLYHADHSHNKWNTEARNVEWRMWNVVHTLNTATTSGTLKQGMWSGECGMLYTS